MWSQPLVGKDWMLSAAHDPKMTTSQQFCLKIKLKKVKKTLGSISSC